MIVPYIFLLVLLQQHPQVHSFSSIVRNLSSRTIITPAATTALYSTKTKNPKAKDSGGNKRPPSRVSDPAGPTPELVGGEPEILKLSDIPELEYDEDAHPIPHQPWRRGLTDGCEDPIDAPWRQEAEELIGKAVRLVGGKYLGCTWFLTSLVVTIDPDTSEMMHDGLKTRGPPISYIDDNGPQWKDPASPNPEELWDDELDIPIYEKDEQKEADLNRQKYARKDDDEDDLDLDDDEVPLYRSQETRSDDALRVMNLYEEMALTQPQDNTQGGERGDSTFLDTAKLSTIAGAIMDVLQEKEDRLRVLARHEIALHSPGPPDYIETQSQFDAHRDRYIVVETDDPWESNRILSGQLIERNSMDLLLNQKGRMVTIPLNFVKCVRLPNARREGDAQDLVEKADSGAEREFVEQADDGDGDGDDEDDEEYDYEDEDEE
jgi:ribosome maturation factor RimP